jgi:putative phosphoesterase
MKWFIASDLHGSAYYGERVLNAYERERADRLLLLGDLLNHGPRNGLPKGYDPMTLAELLNAKQRDIVAVRGNCDSEVDQMILSFPMMADSALLSVGKHLVFATHGHLFNNDRLPPLHDGDILLHGHTHLALCEPHAEYTYLNPGSPTFPHDDFRGYLLLEDGTFAWKTLDGETVRTFRIPDDV